MIVAAFVDQVHVVAQPADADRLALPHDDFHGRRQRATERGFAHPGRRQQALAPAIQIGPDEAFTAQSAQHGKDLALRQPLVAANEDAIDSQDVRVRHAAAIRGRGRTPTNRTAERVPKQRLDAAGPAAAASREGLTCARRNRRSAGAATALMICPRAPRPADPAAVPIEPAPSVMTRSPARAMRTTAGTT